MIDVKTLHHVAISVSDLERSRRFYRDVIGLQEIVRPGFPFDGAWFQLGDRELHLIVARDPTFRTGKSVGKEDGHFAIRVASYRVALAHLQSSGCRIGDDEPGRSMRVDAASATGYPQIHLLDPDRNIIEINAERVD